MNSLPDIPIPYARHLDPCRRGGSGNMVLCLLCQQPIGHHETAHIVLVDDDFAMITAPVTDLSRSRSCFKIGPDCWRNNPQLHPYEMRSKP